MVLRPLPDCHRLEAHWPRLLLLLHSLLKIDQPLLAQLELVEEEHQDD